MAVSTADVEITSLLLQAGADARIASRIHWVFHSNTTAVALLPLAILASSLGTGLQLVQLLIDAGASIKLRARGWRGRTALQAAAQRGNIEVIQLLLQHGADINEAPGRGYGATALQLAAINGFAGVVELLLKAGADPDADGAKHGGRTALEGAAEMGRIDTVKMLLNACNSRNVPRERYERAQRFAVIQRHYVIAEIIKTEMGNSQIGLRNPFEEYDSDEWSSDECDWSESEDD